ncbi:MAG TPA: uracil-DNA glycosylase [Tepidisphaeraceae bacterium]|jgi:uracil-DNA glycosylase family 4|nr:uracil-DNA glycosylase [Tepidisphaeraceae bacterium]
MPASTIKDSLRILSSEITDCDRCPRLRGHCQTVARDKRRAYADWDYWGKPVGGFGDARARIWIVGLAPAAHGANRTGRVFTGDRSGDFLFAALHRLGLANQPQSVNRQDGLKLKKAYVSSAVRCAPPGNKPTPAEIANCSEYLDREWHLLSDVRVMFALGKIGWDAAAALARRHGCDFPDGRRPFGHGAEMRLSDRRWLIGSYHVSQQNTFTGKLTPAMFDAVLRRALQRESSGGSKNAAR